MGWLDQRSSQGRDPLILRDSGVCGGIVVFDMPDLDQAMVVAAAVSRVSESEGGRDGGREGGCVLGGILCVCIRTHVLCMNEHLFELLGLRILVAAFEG